MHAEMFAPGRIEVVYVCVDVGRTSTAARRLRHMFSCTKRGPALFFFGGFFVQGTPRSPSAMCRAGDRGVFLRPHINVGHARMFSAGGGAAMFWWHADKGTANKDKPRTAGYGVGHGVNGSHSNI